MSKLQLKDFQLPGLAPFNLVVNKSECICLSGPSGAGKSLLLRAINDLILHQGEAYLDEKKCSEINPVQWRKWVGFLPAESSWWLDKVGDHFNSQNNDFIKQLNLTSDCFSWDVARCSTGEKQRLAIARLLEQQPKVLLLDEATASLDLENILKVESVIKKYSKEHETPVIWVSHDKQQIKRIADRLFEITNNEIKEVEL